jgi:hypothetical protein
MHSKWLGRVGLMALVTGVVGGSGMMGCAAERDPINRVQGNALPKSFFLGSDLQNPKDDPEFIARTMVVDVPYGESGSDFLMFTNTINQVAKIKWEIEEDFLVGRISFERIDGTDAKGLPVKTASDRDPNVPLAHNNGLPVYQFRIQSQFDIRRAYNSQTGEESNVIEENSSDRRWQDREYIRVDFSQNLNTTSYDFDTMALLGMYNGIKYTSQPFDIQDPNDVNAPVIDTESGYFDVSNKVFAQPQMLDLGGWSIPYCMLPNLIRGGTEPSGNCNANEITLRHSFKRVVNDDYEPISWDGQRFETYGAFTGNRQGYARDYGLVDEKWLRHISRYNVWQRSHFYKDLDKMEGSQSCQSDAQCSSIGAVPGMSHCDTFNQKCTLPFKERETRPIAWFYSDGSAPEYFDATREAAEEWDAAMRVAVNTAKYAECQRFTPDEDCMGKYPVTTGNNAEEEDLLFAVKDVQACRRDAYEKGSDPKSCDGVVDQISDARKYSDTVRAIAKMPEMVVVCHSPVTKADMGYKDVKGQPLCRKEGTVARLGDLRFHLLTNVATPQTNSPWGIMSDSNDPVTGEHIAASINVWTHVNDLFSRGLIDTLRYIGGELKTEDVTDGKNVSQWIEAAKMSNGTGLTPLMETGEIDKRVAAVAGTTAEKVREVEGKYGKFASKANYGPAAQMKKALVANLKKISQTTAHVGDPSMNAPIYEARMAQLRGSPVEAALVTPAMQQLSNSAMGDIKSLGGGGADPNAMMIKASSVLQGLNPQLRRNLSQKLELGLAARGACIMNYEATAPLGYIALGDILQDKFGKFNPNDSLDAQMKRAETMKNWIARRAQYAVIAHEMGHSIGLRHNFVSSSDAWNFKWQYWALRTNGKKVTTECDEATAGDGKACVGPRWIDKVTPNENKNMIQMWAHSSTMEYPGEPSQDLLGIDRYDFGAARMFYGDAVTVYNDAKFRDSQAAGSIAEQHQNEFGGLLGYRYGDFSSPIHYSHLDKEIGLIGKCDTVSDPQAFKPASWNTEKDGEWNPIVDGHLVTNEEGKFIKCTEPATDFVQWTDMKNTDEKTHAHDKKGRVRVPHGFASDEWADLGNVAVFRHDNGADLYETMHFMIAQQEMNHIFSSYRRGRRDFSVWGAFNRNLGRYHEKMRDAAKAIGLYVNLSKDTVALYNDGTDPAGFSAEILKAVALENTVATSIAFDHFTHIFSRPQPGDHVKLGSENDANSPVTILRSAEGTGFAQAGGGLSGGSAGGVKVANGVTGGFGTISLGGRPIENQLASDKGRDYDRDFTLNCGSYYEKAFMAMMFAESADNFISASRDDFVDPRFRAVSLADVFPDGYRRWLANNLTNDEAIKGVYVRPAGTGGGVAPPPAEKDYVVLGNTSWWPTSGAETCFPEGEKLFCRPDPFGTTGPSAATAQVIDPQIGWEQQKFAMVFSMLYINDNQKTQWMDQMRIYDLTVEGDPGFDNRIEFHDPNGHILVAQTFGTETLFGKTVQKGIGARVLEYANSLLVQGVDVEPVVRGTRTVGYKAKLDVNGNVVYKQGGQVVASCDNSRECLKMKNYSSVPRFLMQVGSWLGYVQFGGLKGVY